MSQQCHAANDMMRLAFPENDIYPKLQFTNGGEWRLDIAQRHRHPIGSRVRVIGLRAEVVLLEVQHIDAI